MAYIKVFDYLSTLMRDDKRRELRLPPFSKNIQVQPGYYSKCNTEVTFEKASGSGEEVGSGQVISDLENKSHFNIGDTRYKRREEVFYTVSCGIGAFNSFMKSLKFSKSELNGAELHVICKRATIILWNGIKRYMGEGSQSIDIETQEYNVEGKNPYIDIYGGIYSILYYLMYYVVLENRCEPTPTLDLIKRNIENLDTHWGPDKEGERLVRESIGGAIDAFVDQYIHPHLRIETTKVGQAHVNENLSSIMAEYKNLKTKTYYIMGGQVEETKYFIVLEDYINMVLGQEESFYDLLGLIMAENLHEKEESEKLQERLTVDNDKLENFLKRLIATNLSFIDESNKSIENIRRILEPAGASTASNVEMGIRDFMAEQLEKMETGFIRTPEYEDKLPISKVINTKTTTYNLIAKAEELGSYKYNKVVEWAKHIKTRMDQLARGKVSTAGQITKGNKAIYEGELHAYDKLNLTISQETGSKLPPQITITYEAVNMKQNQPRRLSWDRT